MINKINTRIEELSEIVKAKEQEAELCYMHIALANAAKKELEDLLPFVRTEKEIDDKPKAGKALKKSGGE